MTDSYVDDRCLGIDLGSRRVKAALVKNGVIQEWRSFNTPSFYRLHSRPRTMSQADELEAGVVDSPAPHDGPGAGTGAHSAGGDTPGAGWTGEEPDRRDDTPMAVPGAGRAETIPIIVDFEALGFTRYDRIACTGYGRNNLAVEGAKIVSEVMAHAAGASAQSGLQDFINLDIGGQDFKLTLVRGGRVTDMAANPRCAASSGRFLENMAEVLELGIDELGSFFEDPLPIDSTCSVFAETEVVGLLAQGYPVERIAAGVNRALVRKVAPFADPYLEVVEKVVFTGGCARNGAVVRLLESELRKDIVVPAEPEANGALGSALIM